jgi:uncharacterized protein YjbJ (UPF0337 family)
MNWNHIEGNWQRLHEKVRQQWSRLSDDEINEIEGRRTELAGRIQRAYNVSPDEAERQIKRFVDSLGEERTPEARTHS